MFDRILKIVGSRDLGHAHFQGKLFVRPLGIHDTKLHTNVKCSATVDVTLIRRLNKGQGHSSWYQSISNIGLPIGSQ